MRKILFSLVFVLMMICLAFVMVKGVSVNKIQILSIKGITEKDAKINEKNDELTKLVKVSYVNANQMLGQSAETLEATKKEYEDQAILLGDNKYYGQTEKYKLEFLYTKAGSYARENGVQVKLEFKNSTTAGLYDMYFTVTGSYIDVTQYIYDIENDSKLGFKIEDFTMDTSIDKDNTVKSKTNKSTEESTEETQEKTTNNKVTGKFSCKEIRIDLKNLDSSEIKENDDQKDNQNQTIEQETNTTTTTKQNINENKGENKTKVDTNTENTSNNNQNALLESMTN